MPIYTVHVYGIFKVRVLNIEAESQVEACQRVGLAVALASFAQPGFEYSDDIDGFLVDSDYRRDA